MAISYCIDRSAFRQVADFAQMAEEVKHVADVDNVRITGRLEWPGFWVYETDAPVHGVVPGVNFPRLAWDLVSRSGGDLPSSIVIYQTSLGGEELKTLRVALPLASDGIKLSRILVDSLPQRVAGEIVGEIKAINKRLAEEIAQCERGQMYVPFTSGKGEEGGVTSGHLHMLDPL